jgi:hypothetical protein
MQRRDRSWIIVFILVFLLGALVVVSPLLIPTGAARSFSSDNPGKSGVKAVRDLLEERGMRVQKWERGWDALPSEPGHVLFIIEPDSEGIGHQAFSDLRSWVEGGNTAVIWSRFTPPLLEELGFAPYSETSGPQTVAVHESSERWLRNIRRLVLPGNSRIYPHEAVEAVLTDRQGEMLVARKRIGHGQIFFVPEPEMITNGFIHQGDNVALPLYFASFAEETLWFDEGPPRLAGEAVHGEDPTQNLVNWFRDQGIVVAAEACIALFLWLYVQGKRFAAPRWETVVRLRSQDEYVKAMASLYRSFRLRRESLEILERSFLRDAAKAVGVPPGVSRDRLIERISSLMGKEKGGKFRRLLQEIDQGKQRRIKEKELVRLSQEMERCRGEIQTWKIRP